MFHGFDFDTTMLRIAAMNLMLHGVESPDIHYQDTPEQLVPREATRSRRADAFDVILANPPFKGSLDEQRRPSVADRQGEDEEDGTALRGPDPADAEARRAGGVIVPDGVLFGSSNAHLALRKLAGRREPARGGHLDAGRGVQALRRRVHGHPDLHQGRQDGTRSGSTTWSPMASAWTTSGRCSTSTMGT